VEIIVIENKLYVKKYTVHCTVYSSVMGLKGKRFGIGKRNAGKVN
jgi:hypothetical protein